VWQNGTDKFLQLVFGIQRINNKRKNELQTSIITYQTVAEYLFFLGLYSQSSKHCLLAAAATAMAASGRPTTSRPPPVTVPQIVQVIPCLTHLFYTENMAYGKLLYTIIVLVPD
jgi:hypothetical protein